MSKVPIIVINLNRRPDRMADMGRRLEGIDHVRMPAIDGRELDGEHWRDGLNLPLGSTLNVHEYACSMSHLKAAQQVVAQRHPYACVLEDDVVLSDDFSKFVQSSDWIPDGVELIKCETMGQKVWLTRKGLPARQRHLCELKSCHSGTAGYFISLRGAQKMVELLSNPSLAADDHIFGLALERETFGPIWQLVPALCMQKFVAQGGNADSDIELPRSRARAVAREFVPTTRKLTRELRRLAMQMLELKRRISQCRVIVPMA